MKKTFSLLLVSVFAFSLSSCDLFSNTEDSTNELNDEFSSITGKWLLKDNEDTFFSFDGSKGKMNFSYVEEGENKYSGSFRGIYRGPGKDVTTPLSILIKRNNKEKEDWLGCYTDNQLDNLSQFTIYNQEEDLGMISGSIHTHLYRISQLPYKMGTYILQGKEYVEENNNYSNGDEYNIPSGTYTCETGESFTFLVSKPNHHELFQYKNKDIVIEGSLTIAADKKTIYLYIENDPYSKVTDQDKDHYDTTFDIYYPPDFYLRGEFSNPNEIVINGLYHYPSSPTTILDSTWVYSTYVKQ